MCRPSTHAHRVKILTLGKKPPIQFLLNAITHGSCVNWHLFGSHSNLEWAQSELIPPVPFLVQQGWRGGSVGKGVWCAHTVTSTGIRSSVYPLACPWLWHCGEQRWEDRGTHWPSGLQVHQEASSQSNKGSDGAGHLRLLALRNCWQPRSQCGRHAYMWKLVLSCVFYHFSYRVYAFWTCLLNVIDICNAFQIIHYTWSLKHWPEAWKSVKQIVAMGYVNKILCFLTKQPSISEKILFTP